MSKKLVYFYGNCHTKVLSWMLASNRKFNEKYKLIGFKSKSHTWYAPNMNKIHRRKLESSLKDVDVFIHQKISNNYRGEKWSSDYLKKQTNARCIWLFNYFFRGYAPALLRSDPISYIKNEKYTKKATDFDAMFFWFYANGKTCEETFDWMTNGSSKEASQLVLKTAKDDLAELKRRQTEQINLGNEILGMSDIMETWNKNQLGIFVNHPTMYYYWILCRRILSSLEVEVVEDETWKWRTSEYHFQNDDRIYNYVRQTCPDVKWPKNLTTFNGRNGTYFEEFTIDTIKQEFEKFKQFEDGCLASYKRHKIQKFLPL